jgi:hypothetical protein
MKKPKTTKKAPAVKAKTQTKVNAIDALLMLSDEVQALGMAISLILEGIKNGEVEVRK